MSETRTPEGADQFRLMIDAVVDCAIFMLDTEGRLSTWNSGAERIMGYKTSEIIGKHFSIFYPEDTKLEKPQRELEVAAREGHFEDEGWRLRKDGSKFWANVIVTPVRDENGGLIGYAEVTRDFTERKQHEQRLTESEAGFRLLVEGVPDYAIFMMDPQGRITTWNSGAERIKGYSASEIIGRGYSTFFPEEDVRAGKPHEILETAAREGKVEQEGWRVRKDGSRFWVNALVTALRDDTGKLLGFSKITRDATERMQHELALQEEIVEKQRAQKKLLQSEQSLRALSLHLLRAQDEERRRIGREMHDSIGQYLSALKMKLGLLRVSDPNLGAKTKRELEQCGDLLEECVREVRTISYLLHPPMLDEMGLKSAIDWYLDGFTQRTGIEVQSDISAGPSRLPRDVELALFRVVQESLTNVIKHSGSSKVDIRLARADASAILEVRDYGKGLPHGLLSEPDSRGLGVGLRGMNERMRQLGGSLTVSNASPGTLVCATVPAPDAPA